MFVILLLVLAVSPVQAVRSRLYPSNWNPGFGFIDDRTDWPVLATDKKEYLFLHDFSYAGYHMGEKAIPTGNYKTIFDVTKTPYNAVPNDLNDDTQAIQAAIHSAELAGGGIVYLPAGLYRISPQNFNDFNSKYPTRWHYCDNVVNKVCTSTGKTGFSLVIGSSNVILRGAGKDKTYLVNTDPAMKNKSMILVKPIYQLEGWPGWRWYMAAGSLKTLTKGVDLPTQELNLNSVDGLQVGDWIVVGQPMTQAWIDEMDMNAIWTASKPGDNLAYENGPLLYRRITAIDTGNKKIRIDIPTRLPLKLRDVPAIWKLSNRHIEEIGVEELSMGMVMNPLPYIDANDENKPGTAGYAISDSAMLQFNFVVNGWIRNVSSFMPAENAQDAHPEHTHYQKKAQVLSKGIVLDQARNITVANTYVGYAQFTGGGGNGYLYPQYGSDNLLINTRAEEGRHNYTFVQNFVSGNVLYRDYSLQLNPQGSMSDFHLQVSPANLVDSMTMNGDVWRISYGDTSVHGWTSTQSVLWNIKSLKAPQNPENGEMYLVKAHQIGMGYVIGTSGVNTIVEKALTSNTPTHSSKPVDWVEFEGKGDQLEPQSLYLDQLSRRIGTTQYVLNGVQSNTETLAAKSPPNYSISQSSPTPTIRLSFTPVPTKTPTPTNSPTKTPTPTSLPTVVPPTLNPTATPTPIQAETPTPGGCNKSADLDKSGLVDLSDASQLIVDLGQTGDNLASDLNCDGLVDLSDFSRLVNQLGQS